ncbi:MAG: hypothetical protein J0I91_14915 [Candidatus Accumulibacter sp.]|nr:hypothetical protein [Accumulibacter sp.]
MIDHQIEIAMFDLHFVQARTDVGYFCFGQRHRKIPRVGARRGKPGLMVGGAGVKNNAAPALRRRFPVSQWRRGSAAKIRPPLFETCCIARNNE